MGIAHFVVDEDDTDDGWNGWSVFEDIGNGYLGVQSFELEDKASAEALAAEMNAKRFPPSEEFGTWTWMHWYNHERAA